MKSNFLIFGLIALLLGSQTNAAPWNSKSNFQKTVCHVQSGNDAAKKCKNGDVMFYQPASFGNEQLPLIISTILCDFEYQAIYNKGGVSCIFTDTRKTAWKKF